RRFRPAETVSRPSAADSRPRHHRQRHPRPRGDATGAHRRHGGQSPAPAPARYRQVAAADPYRARLRLSAGGPGDVAIMNLRTGRRRLLPVPRSLLGRMLALTLLAVLLAQGLSSLIWLSQLRASQTEGLITTARSLAQSMAASVGYFRSLPLGYRPLVLDQLRSMGGTRFFVSLNDRPLQMQILPETPRKRLVLGEVDRVLRQRLGSAVDLTVEFVSPEDLRIFNSGIALDELPRSWAHYALSFE